MLTLVMFRCELGKVLLPVLGFDRFKPNNTEAGTRLLTIIRLVMWEGQVNLPTISHILVDMIPSHHAHSFVVNLLISLTH